MKTILKFHREYRSQCMETTEYYQNFTSKYKITHAHVGQELASCFYCNNFAVPKQFS